MKSFGEIKELLMKEYPRYFEILDIDFQARCLMYKPDYVDYKKELDKNMRHKLECEKVIAESKGLRDYELNKTLYERHLKIYKEIIGENQWLGKI